MLELLGNLATDVSEPRTSTGSCIFPSLEHFNVIAFLTSNHRHKNKSFLVHGKEQNHTIKGNIRLPVAIHGSQTSVLKFPIVSGGSQVESLTHLRTEFEYYELLELLCI